MTTKFSISYEFKKTQLLKCFPSLQNTENITSAHHYFDLMKINIDVFEYNFFVAYEKSLRQIILSSYIHTTETTTQSGTQTCGHPQSYPGEN